MLNVLLESRARRPRRVGVTVVSALMHGALAAGAVALTFPHAVDANSAKQNPPVVVYVPIAKRLPVNPANPANAAAPAHTEAPTAPGLPTIAVPTTVPSTLPPIDVGPTIPPDEIRIGGAGARIGESGTVAAGSPLDGNGVLEESAVDRVPRLLGPAASPRYPAALRDAGVQGRVIAQFVIDTLGRAELDGLSVLEAAHPLFAESVRNALSSYRFIPGEAAGHKVRTRVQLPFEFTLKR